MAAARIAAGSPLSVFRIAALRDRLPFFAVPLPDAPCPVIAESKMRHIERRYRYADEIPALPANHLAVRHILPQVLADPAANNLLEAALIALNFHDHGVRMTNFRMPNDECVRF